VFARNTYFELVEEAKLVSKEEKNEELLDRFSTHVLYGSRYV
jgi:hypothetical protein